MEFIKADIGTTTLNERAEYIISRTCSYHELAGALKHIFNNLLVGSTGNAGLLRMHGENIDETHYDNIVQALEKLTRTDGLLSPGESAFSQIEEGKVEHSEDSGLTQILSRIGDPWTIREIPHVLREIGKHMLEPVISALQYTLRLPQNPEYGDYYGKIIRTLLEARETFEQLSDPETIAHYFSQQKVMYEEVRTAFLALGTDFPNRDSSQLAEQADVSEEVSSLHPLYALHLIKEFNLQLTRYLTTVSITMTTHQTRELYQFGEEALILEGNLKESADSHTNIREIDQRMLEED